MERLEKIIQTDPIKAEEVESDQNMISLMVMIKFLIKIIKLALIILNICYFLGIFWFIFCDILFDFAEEKDLSEYSE
jgi:hypothetical protein